MGCDIHLYVEKKNPVTNQWDKIGPVFFDNWRAGYIEKELKEIFGLDDDETWEVMEKYRKGDPPTNRTEQYIINKYFPKRIAKENLDMWDAEQIGLLASPFTDSPYKGRCYSLFGILSHVRSESNPIIGWEMTNYPKGLPDDASSDIYSLSDNWGDDGHSHNYFTVGELLDSSYAKMDNGELEKLGIDPYFFMKVVPTLLEMGKKNEVRIVFWFDN